MVFYSVFKKMYFVRLLLDVFLPSSPPARLMYLNAYNPVTKINGYISFDHQWPVH